MESKFKKFTKNGYDSYYISVSKVNVVRLEQTKDKAHWKIISYPKQADKIDYNKSVLLAMVYDNKFKLLGVEFNLDFEGEEVVLSTAESNNGSPEKEPETLSSSDLPF